jgi:hypothetical protein
MIAMSTLLRSGRSAALIGAVALTAVVAAASPAVALPAFGTAPVSGTGTGGQSVLQSVTVGRHTGFDRVVFTSRQGIGQFAVRYVAQVTRDPSGQPVPLLGSAFLLVTFQGTPWTTSPAPQPTITPGFPILRQVKGAGEFEAVASYGIGQVSKAGFRAFTLTGPARLVVDLQGPASVGAPAAGAGAGTGTGGTGASGLPNTGFPVLPVAAVGAGLLLAGVGGLALTQLRGSGRRAAGTA